MVVVGKRHGIAARERAGLDIRDTRELYSSASRTFRDRYHHRRRCRRCRRHICNICVVSAKAVVAYWSAGLLAAANSCLKGPATLAVVLVSDNWDEAMAVKDYLSPRMCTVPTSEGDSGPSRHQSGGLPEKAAKKGQRFRSSRLFSS